MSQREQRENDDEALMRFEWLEALVRISIAKYIQDKQMTNDISEAVGLFCKEHLHRLPPEATLDTNEFRRNRLYNEEVDGLLKVRADTSGAFPLSFGLDRMPGHVCLTRVLSAARPTQRPIRSRGSVACSPFPVLLAPRPHPATHCPLPPWLISSPASCHLPPILRSYPSAHSISLVLSIPLFPPSMKSLLSLLAAVSLPRISISLHFPPSHSLFPSDAKTLVLLASLLFAISLHLFSLAQPLSDPFTQANRFVM